MRGHKGSSGPLNCFYGRQSRAHVGKVSNISRGSCGAMRVGFSASSPSHLETKRQLPAFAARNPAEASCFGLGRLTPRLSRRCTENRRTPEAGATDRCSGLSETERTSCSCLKLHILSSALFLPFLSPCCLVPELNFRSYGTHAAMPQAGMGKDCRPTKHCESLSRKYL